jgi:hypothetical protein
VICVSGACAKQSLSPEMPVNYKYQIYHDAGMAKGTVEGLVNPLDAASLQYQYRHFEGALAHSHVELLVGASFAIDEAGMGFDIVIQSDLPESVVDASLAQLLIRHNRDVPGLCLVCEKPDV